MSFHIKHYFGQLLTIPPPITLQKARLKRPTSHSNWPPHQGARLRLNLQVIFSDARYSCICSSFWISFISFAAPTKVLPLSEKVFESRPLLVMNRFRLAMKVLVSRFVKTSRYKALLNCRHKAPNRISLPLTKTCGT